MFRFVERGLLLCRHNRMKSTKSGCSASCSKPAFQVRVSAAWREPWRRAREATKSDTSDSEMSEYEAWTLYSPSSHQLTHRIGTNPDSYSGQNRNIGSPEIGFSWFYSVPLHKCLDRTSIRLQPFPFKSVLMHNSSIILSLNAI